MPRRSLVWRPWRRSSPSRSGPLMGPRVTTSRTPTRSPRWSASSLLLVAMASGLATVTLVILLVDRSAWDELRIVVVSLAAPVWLFVCFILYRGPRFDRDDGVRVPWVDPATIAEHMPAIDFGRFASAGAEEGPGGFVVGLLLDIVAAIVLTVVAVVLLWLGINFALVAALVIWLPLLYMFKRSVGSSLRVGEPADAICGLQHGGPLCIPQPSWDAC